MPWNLLIFPLVAGYYLLTRSYFFKFYQQRLDRQRLIFESILIGTALAATAYVLRFLFLYHYPAAGSSIYSSFPYKEPYTITSLSTVVIAILFTVISNRILKEKKHSYVKKAIKDIGNEFELLMESSFSDKVLLQFTLDNNKFYIGWVKELPIPSVSNFVRIIPAISGFRNSNMELEFTSHYLRVYSEYVKEGKIQRIEDLKADLIIDVSEIVTVSYFDPDMYERFNRIKNNK